MRHDAPVSTDLQARRDELGRRLQTLREASALSTRALAQATRISQPFLEALEAGAFERLPGQVFGRGFVRGLCKHLGVEPMCDELLQAYDACWETPAKAPSVLKVQIKNKPRPEASEFWQAVGRSARKLAKPRAAAGLLATLVLAAGVVFAVRSAPDWLDKMPRLAAARDGARNAAASMSEAAGGKPAAPAKVAVAPKAVVVDHDERARDGESAEPKSESGADDDEAVTLPAPADAASGATAAGGQTGASAPTPAGATLAADPAVAATGAEQRLELVVTAQVRVRLGIDGGASETKELEPNTYRFTFKRQADLMVYDASALSVTFNGRPLGPLGSKGRVRRLSFQADAPAGKKL